MIVGVAMTRSTASTTSLGSIGLARYSANPSASPRNRSCAKACAVSAITGMEEVSGSFFRI